MVPATAYHAESLASRLSDHDLDEFSRLNLDPRASLLAALYASQSPVCLIDTDPIALLGVFAGGHLWAIFAAKERIPARWIATECKTYAKTMLTQVGTLKMSIATQYQKSIKLAKWCGFSAVSLGNDAVHLEMRVK